MQPTTEYIAGFIQHHDKIEECIFDQMLIQGVWQITRIRKLGIFHPLPTTLLSPGVHENVAGEPSVTQRTILDALSRVMTTEERCLAVEKIHQENEIRRAANVEADYFKRIEEARARELLWRKQERAEAAERAQRWQAIRLAQDNAERIAREKSTHSERIRLGYISIWSDSQLETGVTGPGLLPRVRSVEELLGAGYGPTNHARHSGYQARQNASW